MSRDLRTGFGFVLNVLDVSFDVPIEIVPGHCFRRARGDEIRRIRSFLADFGGAEARIGRTFPYEHRFVQETETAGSFEVMPPEQWRYYVIELPPEPTFDTANAGVLAAVRASRLCDVELECPAVFFEGGGISYYSPPGVDVFRNVDVMLTRPSTFTPESARDVFEVNREVTALSHAHQDVARAVDMFEALSPVPRRNGLYTLGLFSVLEALLTHDAKGAYDSLTHQIRTKMVLLGRRFAKPLDYVIFGGADAASVWSKLYHVRSCIAHGGRVDFGAAKLQILKCERAAEEFLLNATKAVLRHALREPDLVLDLRAC